MERARRVDGLIEPDVLPESSFRFEDGVLLGVELLAEPLLLRLGGEIRRLDAGDDARDLAREAALRALELRVDLLHLRAARDEDLRLLGVAHLEPAHLLLEPLDQRVGEHARQRVALALLHQPVLRLGRDPRRLGVGHAPAEIGQPLDDRVLAIVERDDGVLAAEVAEGALRVRQLALARGRSRSGGSRAPPR